MLSVHCRTNGSSLLAQLVAQNAGESVSCTEAEEHSSTTAISSS